MPALKTVRLISLGEARRLTQGYASELVPEFEDTYIRKMG